MTSLFDSTKALLNHDITSINFFKMRLPVIANFKCVHTNFCFVPSFSDAESEANLNKINSKVESTFVVYRHRVIVDKFINVKPTGENFKRIASVLDKTKGDYFDLPEPAYD